MSKDEVTYTNDGVAADAGKRFAAKAGDRLPIKLSPSAGGTNFPQSATKHTAV